MSDSDLFRKAKSHIDAKLKPPNSLGLLETWSIRLCTLQQTLSPKVHAESYVVFCADHGAALPKSMGGSEVAAYSPEITRTIVKALAAGGAAGTSFATAVGIPKERQIVVDVGVNWENEERPANVRYAAVRADGCTSNFGQGCAMSADECVKTEEVGAGVVRELKEKFGCNAVALGEVGIGNTTASAALLSAYSGRPAGETCGRGSGLDEEGVRRKVEFVRRALAVHEDVVGRVEAREILAAMGGFEIAAIVGAIHEAFREGVAVMVDGFICSVAALAAVRIWPECRMCLFLATRSAERGFEICRGELGEGVALDMQLRLGEGTGGVVMLGGLKAAAALAGMIGFEEACRL